MVINLSQPPAELALCVVRRNVYLLRLIDRILNSGTLLACMETEDGREGRMGEKRSVWWS